MFFFLQEITNIKNRTKTDTGGLVEYTKVLR